MRPDRKEVMEALMGCDHDTQRADYIGRVLDRVEEDGGTIREPREPPPPRVAVSALEATEDAAAEDLGFEALHSDVHAIGELAGENASRLDAQGRALDALAKHARWRWSLRGWLRRTVVGWCA